MPIQDYLSLVTSQHRQRPKLRAVMTAVLQPLCDLEDLLASMPAAFDVDSAVGAQLDAVGEWVGRSRRLSVPLTLNYLTWDSLTLGWGVGVWIEAGDSTEGIISLPDDVYRVLIRAWIAANAWDGSMEGVSAIWGPAVEASGGNLAIVDNQDMSMSLRVSGLSAGHILLSLIAQGHMPLKPAGVGLSYSLEE